MLFSIIAVLILAWLVGIIFNVGNFIHALLIVALIVFIARLFRGR